jgi:O-glycosyl hydrolase
MRRALVRFDAKLQDWDGFGVNYVEASQTRDYQVNPQEYGGFSTLTETARQQIIDLVFGDSGLKPGVVKMFLDPYHQPEPTAGYDWTPDVIDVAAYDHATTTQWMRHFVREGLARTRARGDDLEIIATLYGPPAWMTVQRFVRGRDLDPRYKYECAKYLISWAKYLRESEGFPVKYVCLHNEGEDWRRWPLDGGTAGTPNHDYNLYWPPEQVVDFCRFMRPMLDAQGMADVGIAPGETSNWYRFYEWGYADALADDPLATANLGLITSHGFYGRSPGRWYGDWRSAGIDAIRSAKPELHAWVTSTSWSQMDAWFVWEIHNNIYSAKVNAIIPWATVQRTTKWVGGDPNPGTAIRVDDSGRYTVEPGYYFFKQVCRAGQPGMAVTKVLSNDSEICLIAFAKNGTPNPDVFVLTNLSDERQHLDVEIHGTDSARFDAYRTSPEEQYVSLGAVNVSESRISYDAPAGSVTTFYGR